MPNAKRTPCCGLRRAAHGHRRLNPERLFVCDTAVRLVLGGQPTKRDGEWLLAGYCKLQRMEPTQ
jgi:hypothetical protein